jgi:hypothetical protein
VYPSYAIFYESSFVGGKHVIAFKNILCVLMSADNVLSLQVGQEVYSLPVNPSKAKHQATIAALLQGISQSI